VAQGGLQSLPIGAILSMLKQIAEMILSGTCVRMALMDRRSELIRCASIVKDRCFDDQISALDDVISKIWDANQIELNIVN